MPRDDLETRAGVCRFGLKRRLEDSSLLVMPVESHILCFSRGFRDPN